jgi:hypothetical protein
MDNFVNPDNENSENSENNESNIVIEKPEDNSLWSVIVKYYKQIILFLLIFVIIFVIEKINKYNLMSGAPTPSIPGIMSTVSTAIKKKTKGKQ